MPKLENHKILRILFHNQEHHENLIFQLQNNENYKNCRISCQNLENHENLIIHRQKN